MRENRSFLKELSAMIPLAISGVICMVLIFFLYKRLQTEPTFALTLNDVSTIFIAISGFLAAIIMVYLAASAIGLKSTRNLAIDNLSKITQKMHQFRSIIEILINSKIWMPGLKEYIDEEFAGLTFFEVKEFYKGKSKLAIEFLQEHHPYDDTENLYLELKSLLLTNPKEKKLPENIRYPSVYNKDIVAKWLEHKCGSGLWYYFGYKYGNFKSSLDYNNVFERHQEKIMTLANTIDSEAFQDSTFNEVFLAKLGEYMSKEVIPKLFQFQGRTDRQLPGMIRYLYGIFIFLVIFGVLMPLAQMLLGLPDLVLAISFSIVIAIIFFIATSFYQFVNKEANG